MASFRRSLALSLAQRYSELALRLAATIVLARLLTPEEIGAFAVVASLATLATVLCDFGVQSYIVQERELTPARRSAAVGLTTFASLVWAAVFAGAGFAAPLLGSAQPLAGIVLVLSVTMALTPLTWPSMGSLQREMRFGALYAISAARAATFAGSAIGLAALGFGAMALAWACLAENIVGIAICAAYVGRPPRPLIATAAWRDIARFGAFATTNSVISRAGEAVPGLAAGQILGLGATGLLNRAQTLLGLFDKLVIHGVGPVMLPYLSERVRQGADLAPAYVAKVAFLTVVAWPAFGFVALTAGSIVRVLLGTQWDEAVPLVRILCLSGVILPFNAMNLAFFMALGLLPAFTRRQAAVQAVRSLMAVAAAFAGLPAIAMALVLADLARLVVVQSLLARHVRYSAAALANALARSAGVAIATLVPVILVLVYADPGTPLARLVVTGIAAAAGWLAGIYVFRHPLRDELGHLRANLRRRDRRAAPPTEPPIDE